MSSTEPSSVARIGVIGGTGLEDIGEMLNLREEVVVETPFGKPAAPVVLGELDGVPVALLPRHGRRHQFGPSQVNYRANVWALRRLGCTKVLAATACGSLREDIVPGHFVVLDQFIDRTTKRVQTFYDGSSLDHTGVCHIPMGYPFCPSMRSAMCEVLRELQLPFSPQGTMVTIEGPRFSTRAESELFRSWKCDVINMTTVPEAPLVREAGMCYASIAMATDYDSWHDSVVDVPTVMRVVKSNSSNFVTALHASIRRLASIAGCECSKHVAGAVLG